MTVLSVRSPKRPITLVPLPEDPVKRRLLKKTDMRNDELVMNVDEHLMNVVSEHAHKIREHARGEFERRQRDAEVDSSR